jgi:hypothetical protein
MVMNVVFDYADGSATRSLLERNSEHERGKDRNLLPTDTVFGMWMPFGLGTRRPNVVNRVIGEYSMLDQ